MEIHEEFTKWAVDQGVKTNGVKPHRFEGRGLGIIATKNHKTGDTILSVPITALRTAHTVPKTIRQALHKDITVHGLLAADLALDTSTHRAAWRAVLPTYQDFLDSVPLLWDPALQALLPAAAQTLLENQQRKLKLDWSMVSAAFPSIHYEAYLHAWLLVNTRTFYFLLPKTKTPTNRDDCMALNPFADYFNHTAVSTPSTPCCDVQFSSTGYKFTTPTLIKKDEEIYISYGNHSNDFLLAEYGFILADNKWDEIPFDDHILPLLSASQRETLKDTGFLSKYVLDRETICHRTQVALRLLCLTPRKWQRFVNGIDDAEKDQAAVDKILLQALNNYREHIAEMRRKLDEINAGFESQREALSRRWKQIDLLLTSAIDRIQS